MWYGNNGVPELDAEYKNFILNHGDKYNRAIKPSVSLYFLF